MMDRAQPDLRGALRCADDVTITRLPFGGAVLVNGRTLALLESAEPDAAALAALLTAPARGDGLDDEMATVLERTASRLVADGWLVPAPNGGVRR
jgi:hypothetical protein